LLLLVLSETVLVLVLERLMMNRWMRRTEAMSAGSIEYEYEYRDAEYE
jgi:hypothetical protein